MRIDFSAPIRTIQGLVDSFLASTPRLLLAAILIGFFWILGRTVRDVARRVAQRKGEQRTLELAIGRLAQSAILLVGVLVAITAAFPSFTPADLVSTLGIGGVAIGFAFKDIFQNFVAGILILIAKPFRVGDQIIFGTFEGTVEDIQTRATLLRTYDGRRVIIPNGDLYTSSVTVNTAFLNRRMQYDVGIGYGDDVELARSVILEALTSLDGVADDPAPDVLVVALADSYVTLRARWWGRSHMGDALKSQDAALTLIKQRLTAAAVDLPFPTRVVLWHDQTEAGDGDRRHQREGWPAGDKAVPMSARALDRGASFPPAVGDA